MLRPKTVVTNFVHKSSWCPNCKKFVIKTIKNEIINAPIGPNAKSAALFLRHELKLPYRKIKLTMNTLFGIDFAPASILGFEKRARYNADYVYDDLIEKMRVSDIVHADETYWREDGVNHILWYAGTTDVAVFRVDKSRSSEAAKILLGDKIDGLLVTDAYAGYNAVEVKARQSCLAHLLRRAKDVIKILESKKYQDQESIIFCQKIIKLFVIACRIKIPNTKTNINIIKHRLTRLLDSICSKPLDNAKAETLRKRLLPGAREHEEVFAFIDFDGPPTNNHAERALRPLVISRKISMGTRSKIGSENIAIFASIVETAKLQNAPVLTLMNSLLTETPAKAQAALFNDSG